MRSSNLSITKLNLNNSVVKMTLMVLLSWRFRGICDYNFANYFNIRRISHLALHYIYLSPVPQRVAASSCTQQGSSTSKKPQGTLVKLSQRFIGWRGSLEHYSNITRDHSRNRDLCRERPLNHRSRRGTEILVVGGSPETECVCSRRGR